MNKEIEMLRNQLDLFKERVKETPDIEPNGNKPEEERVRILSFLDTQKGKLEAIPQKLDKTVAKTKDMPPGRPHC